MRPEMWEQFAKLGLLAKKKYDLKKSRKAVFSSLVIFCCGHPSRDVAFSLITV
jgi:hypothetical protein